MMLRRADQEFDWVSTTTTLLLLFTCVVLIEAAVLARASKRPSLIALRDSFVANSLSTAAGVCLITAGVFARDQTNIAELIVMFVSTWAIETPALLAILRPSVPPAQTLYLSIWMNAASYVLMALLLPTGCIR